VAAPATPTATAPPRTRSGGATSRFRHVVHARLDPGALARPRSARPSARLTEQGCAHRGGPCAAFGSRARRPGPLPDQRRGGTARAV